MATAAPVSITWIPEDDLLLKNAVEAGASLEALAKGAVQFSRRFSFQELRDRWYSLLYDPDISTQASARMSELELSGFNPLTKSNRSDQIKINKEIPQKRKHGSIRKQYYSMRKKFRSEFFNSTDLNFLDEPGLHDRSGHGADFQDNFEFQEADIEILRSAFLTGSSNTVEEKHRNGFAEDLSASLRQGGRTSFDSIMQQRAISSFMKGNSGNLDEHLGADESRQQMQHMSVFGSSKENPQSVFHGLRQGEHLNSPNGNSSFHSIGFPSPHPNLPLWDTEEDFSATPLPVILKQGDTTQDANKMLIESGDGQGKDSLAYNVVPAGTLLGVRHNGPGINNSSAVAECEDLSDSLLNLSNEDEILLIDVDAKDTSEKSYCDNLNSLLLSSPSDVQEDCVSHEPEILVVSETCLAELNSTDGEPSEAVPQSDHVDHQIVHHPEVEVPSTSVINPDSHALGDGSILCTLNTEDPEIPCNDDIFLLIHPSTSFATSAPQPITRDSMDLSSAANQNQTGEVNLRIKGKDLVRSSSWSQKVGQNFLTDTRPVHSLLGFAVKSELPDSNSPSSLLGESNKSLPTSSQSRPLHANPSILAVRKFEEDVARVELKTGETTAASVELQNTEAGSSKIGLPELIMNPSISEEEESHSDDDVPYFSDIEAMMLENDLDPYDQESWSTKQAAKYQYEGSKETIIRLEKCAQSCHERAMTSFGAFATFYGRHLKHCMRKTEVILGRSTDDVDVDIDLRKEGHANKISRRQAIIRMEGDGSFHLKNLGKSLISVNGKSIATGQLLNLSSSCLIEIRGMSFVFEINHKFVRRYLCSISQQSTGKNNKFDWSPEVDI